VISLGGIPLPPQTSWPLLRNTSNEEATATLQFWTAVEASDPGSGTLQHQITDLKIPGNTGTTIRIADMPQIPQGWRGSMVIISDKELVANALAFGAPGHSVYEGIESNTASNVVLLPSIQWNPLGQDSQIGVQNVQNNNIQVRITYFDETGNPVGVGAPSGAVYNVPPNTSLMRQSIIDCAGCPAGPSGRYSGSVRVETVNSSDKVAVAVMTRINNTSYAYSGLPASQAGSTFLQASAHRNPAGQYSFTLVQNTSETNDTDVTIEYRDIDGTPVPGGSFTKNIAPKGSYVFATDPTSLDDPVNMGIDGSAKITSSDTDIVVSVVVTVGPYPYSYNAIRPADAKPTQSLPGAYRNVNGQFSFTLIQNASDDPADNANCTISYKDNISGLTSVIGPRSVPAKGSYVFGTVETPSVPASDIPLNLGDEGSAVVNCVRASDGTTPVNVVGVSVVTVGGIPSAYETSGSN
jgi:hypothetical protein